MFHAGTVGLKSEISSRLIQFMSSFILGFRGFRAEPALIWTQSQCTAVCVWAAVVFMCLASFIMLSGHTVLQHIKPSDPLLGCAQEDDATEVIFFPVKTILLHVLS